MSSVLVPLAGGALIGLAASMLLLIHGRVAGVSGILGELLTAPGERTWRLAFILGLVAAGVVGAAVAPAAIGASPASKAGVVIAGLLVGFGTRTGGGCTSGHGVCGISRLSPRSLVATVVFIAAAMITVAVVRALGGWS
ncbi:MAG TPA: YeeE/YedE thiosulfate transporter family protein [Kofleriaceae bacterium]|nr:YeeE/YedE thiosulfate transporter family protein [Kofleriaceae bacterium]